jgi:[acyl-carrier-protein] S-malonyltransferase
VVCNVDAAVVHSAEAARATLIRQVTGTVKWEPSVRLLIGKGASLWIEVGPGKVLWGLMRQIDRSQTCMTVGDEASLRKTMAQVGAAA